MGPVSYPRADRGGDAGSGLPGNLWAVRVIRLCAGIFPAVTAWLQAGPGGTRKSWFWCRLAGSVSRRGHGARLPAVPPAPAGEDGGCADCGGSTEPSKISKWEPDRCRGDVPPGTGSGHGIRRGWPGRGHGRSR